MVAPDATLLEGLLALRISLLCSSRSVDGFLDILPDLVVVPDASEVGESVVLTGLCTSYPAGALRSDDSVFLSSFCTIRIGLIAIINSTTQV